MSQDSKFWDDFEDIGEYNLLNSKITQILIFLCLNEIKIIINGIGITFKNLVTSEIKYYEYRGNKTFIEKKYLILMTENI